MRIPLRGIRFRTLPEILQAVDRSIRTIRTTGAAKGILRLPHHWQRVVHNALMARTGKLHLYFTCFFYHYKRTCCKPCGAVQRTEPQVSPRTPTTCIAATTPELIVGILTLWHRNFVLNFSAPCI